MGKKSTPPPTPRTQWTLVKRQPPAVRRDPRDLAFERAVVSPFQPPFPVRRP